MGASAVVDIRVVSRDAGDLLLLVDALDADIESRYPGHRICGVPAPQPGLCLMVAYVDDKPLGCGALRPLEPGSGEVRRMFVQPWARRLGVGRALLAALEHEAAERGYTILRLESGLLQPEALALYEACGYTRIPCYGEYQGSARSVCYEKALR